MLIKIPAENIFQKDFGWHQGRFHFSFGEYQDSSNQEFGVLCAFNDFVVQPQNGFETHPHAEVEIISYCVNGTLKHKDNMGNVNELRKRDSQYTCTGSGILHSELNENTAEPLRFLQIWIKPNRTGLDPFYSEGKYIPDFENGKLRHLASGKKVNGALHIAQDANVYALEIVEDQMVEYESWDGRQSYVVNLEGEVSVNGFILCENDAMKMWGRDCFKLIARKPSHLVIIEMAKP